MGEPAIKRPSGRRKLVLIHFVTLFLSKIAKAAFSAGADAARLGAHRTRERPRLQTDLLPAPARAKPQTDQGHLTRLPRRIQMNASYLSALFRKVANGMVIFVCPLRRADTAASSGSLFMVSRPSATLGLKRATAFPLPPLPSRQKPVHRESLFFRRGRCIWTTPPRTGIWHSVEGRHLAARTGARILQRDNHASGHSARRETRPYGGPDARRYGANGNVTGPYAQGVHKGGERESYASGSVPPRGWRDRGCRPDRNPKAGGDCEVSGEAISLEVLAGRGCGTRLPSDAARSQESALLKRCRRVAPAVCRHSALPGATRHQAPWMTS